jgi:hypothetical protein
MRGEAKDTWSRKRARGRLYNRVSTVCRRGSFSGEKCSHDLERDIGIGGAMVNVVGIATCRSPDAHNQRLARLILELAGTP